MHETPPLLVDKSGTMSIEIISGINATFYCSHKSQVLIIVQMKCIFGVTIVSPNILE